MIATSSSRLPEHSAVGTFEQLATDSTDSAKRHITDAAQCLPARHLGSKWALVHLGCSTVPWRPLDWLNAVLHCCTVCSCVFDLPFFFCRGADRMRVLSNLLGFAFDKVEARPKAVNLQLINTQVNIACMVLYCAGGA